jgi:hypothetical protein
MMETLDYTKFDKHVKEKLKAGKFVEVTDEIIKLGNIVDPDMIEVLLTRVVENNLREVKAVLNTWGFKEATVSGKDKFGYTIDSFESLRRIETLFNLKFYSEYRPKVASPDYKEKLPFVLYVDLKFDFGFLKKKIGLNKLMEVHGRLSVLNSWAKGNGALITVDSDDFISAFDILSKKLVETIAKDGEGIQSIEPKNLEKLRATLNQGARDSGNKFVNALFAKFMDSMESQPDLGSLQKVCINLHTLTKQKGMDRDVEQTYRQMINFAFSLLLDKLETDKTIDKNDFLRPLLALGFVIEEEVSNLTKALSGQYSPGQVVQKTMGKILGSGVEHVGEVKSAVFEAGMRDGATAEYLCSAGECTKENSEAMLLTIDQDKVDTRLEVSQQGVVNTSEVKKQLGDSYFASAPIAFSG